jgi:hypothetical protein
VSHQLKYADLITYDTSLSGIELPVILRVGSESTQFQAKLDTGASHCIFERLHGEFLGFDIEAGEPLTIDTVTGSFKAFGHWVTLSVKQFEFDVMVYFAQDYGFRRNVLGRQGFIQLTSLGLVDYDGQLFISHYDAP